MLEVIIATKNKKKFKEIREILKGFNLKLSSLTDYDKVPRIIENGKTFKENAIKKAVKIANFSKKFTLAGDTGLCVNSLDGEPGI